MTPWRQVARQVEGRKLGRLVHPPVENPAEARAANPTLAGAKARPTPFPAPAGLLISM